ncbi:helix-turn-helix domain-containing protein [Oryzomicrobium sp.]|uniref:helix-turn-helix transcriptional regulator n=1 Tax=Oryzomicrobium sp. TaxID=1911578 RepID=UPI00342A4B30
MNTPYKLVTKEAAAELLCVSKRTIDNWISDGTLPMPTNIGRRVYWHPDVFRSWEDGKFGVLTPPECTKTSQLRRGRPRAQMA